jgi:hypothetical protein
VRAERFLFLPLANVVLTARPLRPAIEARLHESLAAFKEMVLRLHREMAVYIASAARKRTRIAAIGHPNFAHHVLNELAAIDFALRHTPADVPEEIWVDRETVAPIERIVPEVTSRVVRLADLPYQERFRRIVADQVAMCSWHAQWVTSSLRNRLADVAQAITPVPARDDIARLRSNPNLVVWVSVKEDNRRCLNLPETISTIVRQAARRFGPISLILDGVSFPWDWKPAHGGRIFNPEHIEAVNGTIQRILSECREHITTWVNLNGRSIAEALEWSKSADVYFCHYGSQQHKLFFASERAHGLIHGNDSVVSRRGPRLSYMRALGDFRCDFVPRSAVRDAETVGDGVEGLRGSVNLKDYRLVSGDVQSAWQKTLDVMETVALARRKRSSKVAWL